LAEEEIASRQVFNGRAIRVRVATVRKPDGRETTREIVEHDGVIAAIPIDDDDNVLLVRQYRTPAGRDLLEIPAGGIDPGEQPEATVVRELQEEIGYKPGKLVRLGGFFSAPGYATEYLHIYLAIDLTPGRLHAEDTDEIELVKVKLSEVPGLIGSGQIEDAKSIAGLLMYLEYRKSHQP
jgi:ADP-ribose pyrophosphatase